MLNTGWNDEALHTHVTKRGHSLARALIPCSSSRRRRETCLAESRQPLVDSHRPRARETGVDHL